MSSYDVDRGSSGIIKQFDSEVKIADELKAGEKVRIKHFNISEYAITQVLEVKENSIIIKITDKLIRYNVFPGDSITVIFINKLEEECLIDGIVEKAQAEFPQFISIRCSRIRRFTDPRRSRRYEVDICCNIIYEGNTFFGNIKNISFTGCRLITKANIEDRKNFKIELFIKEGKKAALDVGVVRNKKHFNFSEYGLTILGMDDASKKNIQERINEIIEIEKIIK